MYNLKSVFQLISTNDLQIIHQQLPVLAPFLTLTLGGEDGDGFNNFTWHNAGGTFLHVENLSVPVARFLLKTIALNHEHDNNEQKAQIERLVNAKNRRQETPLHIAAETGNVNMVILLLDNWSEVDARNGEWRTPLHCAVAYDESKYSESNAIMTVFALTRHEEETAANSNTKNNIYEDIHYIDLRDKNGDTALKIAQDRSIRNLVTALEFCRTRSTIQHELMRNIHGARQREFPKEKYEQIIGSLAHHGRISITFKKDAKGRTVVHLACLYGLDFILENLFRYFSVKVRVMDNEGRTPLHCAVLSENLEGGHKCLDILLREDRNNSKSVKDVRDKSGKTALRIALERSLIPACTSLLAYGCDIYGEFGESAPLAHIALGSRPKNPAPTKRTLASLRNHQNLDMLFQIYNKMPATIVPYLNAYGGYIDYNDDLRPPQTEDEIIGRTRKQKSKRSELFYTFSPLIGLRNYNVLKATKNTYGLKPETTYLRHLLKFPSTSDKSIVMNHPLVKLFIHLKWKKLKCIFYAYQILSFLMLLLYSWFIFDVYTVWCPYKGVNANGNVTRSKREDQPIAISGRSAFPPFDHNEDDFYPHEDDPIFFSRMKPQPPAFQPQTGNTFSLSFPTPTTSTTMTSTSTSTPASTPWSTPATTTNDRPEFTPEFGAGLVQESCTPTHAKFIATALLVYAAYIMVKEICQMYHRDIFYGYKTKIWQFAEGTLMAINCGSIFFADGDTLEDWRYTVAGFGLCVSWILLIHQIGKIPQAGKYVAVLKTVTYRSVRLILTFTPLLIAFSFTFKILLPGNQQFQFLPTGFVKSVVMMSGELDYTDLFYNPQNVIRSPCSLVIVQIFFGLFVFVMPIVLLNLLIGLAVTEIKVVVQQGRTHHLLAQLEQITIMENILFWISRTCRKICGKWTCAWLANFLVVDKAHVNNTICNKHKPSWTGDFYSNAEISQDKLRAKIRELCQKSYYSSQY